MRKIHSHYDNLKVARHAPDALIKAAYRTLSQQYHPDLAKSPESARIMGIINASYAVLSDPLKRKEHDHWLAARERAQTDNSPSDATSPASKPVYPQSPTQGNSIGKLTKRILQALPFQAWLAICVVLYLVLSGSSTEPVATKPYQPVVTQVAQEESHAAVRPVRASYERPLVAPNGKPWPYTAGYLKSYGIGRQGGRSTVKIDNTNNQYDVYVKLVYTDQPVDKAVRHVFIPKNASFTMLNITQGGYEIRYKNLDTGQTFQPDHPLRLTEIERDDEIQYSNIRMTLYSVENGNMQTRLIPEHQF